MLRQVLPCSLSLQATRRFYNTQPPQSPSSGSVFACLISRQRLSAWTRGCADSFELFVVLSRLLGTQPTINHSFVAADMIHFPTWWNQDPLVWLLYVWSGPPAAMPPLKSFVGIQTCRPSPGSTELVGTSTLWHTSCLIHGFRVGTVLPSAALEGQLFILLSQPTVLASHIPASPCIPQPA